MSRFAALVLSLPTRDSTLRMRLWRTLKETGCGVLRDGVYVLPAGPSAYESFEKRESEIWSYGGFAMAIALDEQLTPSSVLVLRGKGAALAMWQAELARQFLPAATVLGIADEVAGLPAPLDKPGRPGPVNAWLCRGVTCLEPIGDLVHLKEVLKEKA